MRARIPKDEPEETREFPDEPQMRPTVRSPGTSAPIQACTHLSYPLGANGGYGRPTLR